MAITNENIREEMAIILADKMSVPCHSNYMGKFDKENPDRLVMIDNELQSSAYQCIEKNDYFWLYSKRPIHEIKGRILLISSHADCLQPQKVFERKGESIHGIFDNAITNAASLYLMKYCEVPDHVIFAFTADEEDGSRGAEKVIEYLDKAKFNTIVLDVTCCGYQFGADFTIENDFIYKSQKEWMKRIIECAISSGLKWKYIQADSEQKEDNEDDYYKSGKIQKKLKEECRDALSYEKNEFKKNEFEKAEEDETYKYDEYDISCVSLCLPCDAEFTCQDKDMHDPGGFGVRISNYLNYIAVLLEMCRVPVN